MATLHQILSAVQGQISLVTSSIVCQQNPVQVLVGLHWPPVRTIQQAVKLNPPSALISVFDRKSSHDSTRWIPSVSAITAVAATLSSSPTTQNIPAGGSGSLTIAGPVTAGDAVSLAVFSGTVALGASGDGTVSYIPTRAVVVSPVVTNSASDVAGQLVAAVAADPSGTGQWVQAVQSGSTVQLTNLTASTIVVSSYTGNGGTQVTEIARRRRDIQLTVWAAADEILSAVGDPIEDMISQIETFRGHAGEYTAGLVLQDGTAARIHSINDFLVDDAVLSDMYRRDFIFSADYGITTTDNLYSVLVPVQTSQIGYSSPPLPPNT